MNPYKIEVTCIPLPPGELDKTAARRAYLYLPEEFYEEDRQQIIKQLEAIYCDPRVKKKWHTPNCDSPCPACEESSK